MRARLALVLGLLASSTALSGCAAAAIGAGGAVIADSVAEDRGGNLF